VSGAGLETVLAAIARTGLVPRGAFLLSDDERRGELAEVRTIVLAGMAGRDGWSAFAASPEAADGADHPLDRWSRRVIEALARDLGATALFPFGGPPFWPFQQWARRSEPVYPSPIGLLIHPAYGLWHSYRGALGFRQALDVPEVAAARSPCESCRERPCLNACPVGAFSSAGYDVAACAGHLERPAGADCMSAGCRARRACPVGAEHAYGEEQANFSMRAFLRAQAAAR
jgi:ferredoxin